TVTGDAAVHLMGDEGPQFLVHVGALTEAIAALVVAGHHRHVLQMAMPPFLAYGTVMRVVDHQPFDDAGAERLGFLVVNRDPAVIRGGGHAGHDQPAAGIVFIAVLLDCALAAGAYAPQRRVPAEVGHIEAEGQAGLQQAVRPVDFVVFTIYMNSGHGCTVFLPAVRVLIMEFRVCAGGGNGHPTSPPAPSISSRLYEFGSRLAGRWRLADTGLELAAEILDGAAQWLYRARCVGAEGLARPEEVDQAQQHFQVLRAPLTPLQGPQRLDAPGQAITAGRAPAAGFPGEELLHVAQQRHHVHRLVDGQRQAGAHTGPDLADTAGVHLRLEVFGQQEAGAGAAGLPAFQGEAVAHAAGVVLEQLTGGDTEGEFPDARVLDLAGEAHQL